MKGASLNLIKYLLLNAFVGVHTLLFCLIAYLLCIFDRTGRLVHQYSAVPWAKVILWVSGVKVMLWGKENVNPGEPYVYMSNHQSYFDILALLSSVSGGFKFIVKQELMRIPVFGFAMRRAGYIGIERKEHRKAMKSMDKAAEKIKSGVSVLIFPEGTRGIDGRLQEFKRGGFMLALKSGCDIVPVAIKNSYRIAHKGSMKINKGIIDIYIDRPISVDSYTRRNVGQLMEEVREKILFHIE